MASSMTGFGCAQGSGPRYAAEIEVRSLNNRYLKVRIHAPSRISTLEPELENFLRSKLSRGAVDIWIKVTDTQPAKGYHVDVDLARRYREFASALADDMKADGALSLSDYMLLPGVISAGGDEADGVEELEKLVMGILADALDSLQEMRRVEGRALVVDIAGRADVISTLASEIAVLSPNVVIAYRDRLLARINELLSGSNVEIAEENIVRETSIFAERSDISEELARIESHIGQLRDTLRSDGDMGRKLEFVAQELHREINTIGSKANDASISRLVVDAKGEIDRIREQSANLE